jgi:hypothetical protein
MRRSREDWPFGAARTSTAPLWRREEGVRTLPRRWSRAPEPWEEETEAFPGAVALNDLARVVGDAAGTKRVLARYLVLRFVLERGATGRDGAMLRTERTAARRYVESAWSDGELERRALEAALRTGPGRARAGLCASLCVAGGAAALAGHDAGARALYRTGYRLALAGGWLAEAGEAALALADLAQAGGGRHSARLWRRRAAVLFRAAGCR